MKATIQNSLEIFIASVNYIIINYALSNMAMLLQSNPLSILFFASEIWITVMYWKNVYRITQNKIISAVLFICCFAAHIGMLYFVGRIVGTILPFKN
ncbi:MAG: hypothetical protein ACLUKQ_04890 [Peptococcaceae bacterium]